MASPPSTVSWDSKDGWSCDFWSLHITNVVVDHWVSFSDVRLTAMPPGFVDYVLGVVNADRRVRVIQAPNDVLEGVTALPCPPTFAPNTQFQVAPPKTSEGVQATPSPSNKVGPTSQEVATYKRCVAHFAADWCALKRQPTIWVHWSASIRVGLWSKPQFLYFFQHSNRERNVESKMDIRHWFLGDTIARPYFCARA